MGTEAEEALMLIELLKFNPDAWYELWVPLRDLLDRHGLLPSVRRVERSKPIPMLCPNCGCGVPRVLREDAERGDFDTVTCPDCGWVTDMYEAQCAAEQSQKVRLEEVEHGISAKTAIELLRDSHGERRRYRAPDEE